MQNKIIGFYFYYIKEVNTKKTDKIQCCPKNRKKYYDVLVYFWQNNELVYHFSEKFYYIYQKFITFVTYAMT